MSLIQLGVGESGEPVIMEKVHDACVFIHCAGNACSPFEFNGDAGKTAEENARCFASILAVNRMEVRMEEGL